MVLFFHCIVCNRKQVGSAGQKICKHCLKTLKCARCQKKLSGDGREFEIIKTHGIERVVCVECLSKERFQIITEEIEKLFSANKISAAKEFSGDQKFINTLIPGLTGDTVGKILTFLSFPKSLKNLYLVSQGFRDFFDETNFFFIESFGDPDFLIDGDDVYPGDGDEIIKEDLLQLCRMKNFQGFGHLKRLNHQYLSIKGLLFFLHFIPNSMNSLECVNTLHENNELHPQITELFMNKVMAVNVVCCRIETNLVENVFNNISLESMTNLRKLWIEGESLPKYKLVLDFARMKSLAGSLETLILSNCRMHKFENVENAGQVRNLVLHASRTNPYNLAFPNLETLEIRKDTMLSLRNLASIKNVSGMKSITVLKGGPLNPNGFVAYPNLEVLIIPDSLFTSPGLEGFFSGGLKRLRHLEVMSMLAKYVKVMLMSEGGSNLRFVKIHRSILVRDEQLVEKGTVWVLAGSSKKKIVLEVGNDIDEMLKKKIEGMVVLK